MRCTPCSASLAPPTAISSRSGRIRRSAEATPAAWRSPEASQATNRTLRMMVRVPNQRRKSQLDLIPNSESDTQPQSPFLGGNHHWSLALERGDEALQLELE